MGRRLPAGAYALHASDATHGEGKAVGTASNDPPWVRVFLREAALGRAVLEVRVLDPAGESVPGAAVEVGSDIGVAARQATADERGVATFEHVGVPRPAPALRSG